MSTSPFRVPLEKALPKSDALDMTTANRVFAWLALMPVIRSDKRPSLLIGETTGPIATFEDLKEALSLVDYASGVRPYVLDWFNEVLMPKYADKQGPVSTRDLVDWMKEKKGKRVSRRSLRQNFCEPLYHAGYLDKEKAKDGEGDKREVLYIPVKDVQGRLFQDGKISVKNPALFPSKENLITWIKDTIEDAEIQTPPDLGTAMTLSVEELVEKYYSDPETCFQGQY